MEIGGEGSLENILGDRGRVQERYNASTTEGCSGGLRLRLCRRRIGTGNFHEGFLSFLEL